MKRFEICNTCFQDTNLKKSQVKIVPEAKCVENERKAKEWWAK